MNKCQRVLIKYYSFGVFLTAERNDRVNTLSNAACCLHLWILSLHYLSITSAFKNFPDEISSTHKRITING
jgi:hypothetical protein